MSCLGFPFARPDQHPYTPTNRRSEAEPHKHKTRLSHPCSLNLGSAQACSVELDRIFEVQSLQFQSRV